MTPLGRALAERIKAEGPLSVEAYMDACNAYYYATRDPLGAGGDFTTAPEICCCRSGRTGNITRAGYGPTPVAGIRDPTRRPRLPRGAAS